MRRRIDACLEGRGGEVSARAQAADLGESYLVLNSAGRLRFLQMLEREYDTDPEAIEEAIDRFRSASARIDGEERSKKEGREYRIALDNLRSALIPRRLRLFKRFNGLNGGVKFLVDLRADVIDAKRERQDLVGVDEDLRALLASWFDPGFLKLRRITWESPAFILEKLIGYEAVHEIRSWDDLKNRLEPDRRCYAFFHPNMHAEPLIFVQVALVRGMSSSVQALLDPTAPLEDPHAADCAIFYSISNCQRGLSGVSFGNFLIKQVATDIARELPNIKTFATLSPLPDFRSWLDAQVDKEAEFLDPAQATTILELADKTPDNPADISAGAALRRLLDRPNWNEDEELANALRPILLHLAARFLGETRASGAKGGKRSPDRVAHFHLDNGARIERINWLGDISKRGLAQSAGIMVNYRYILADVEKNHEAYCTTGEASIAPEVKRLANGK
ncbi:MAG: malonyl-CoA decarboxylase [Ectothiorhodospiraceae bacterium AqS1]|nr:malonyl-CoA decarboxylase [Ectothiorhodospiraceae bacterium AqS1]